MPESKVRKQAAEKKLGKTRAKLDKQGSQNKHGSAAAGTRDWVPWVFVPAGLLGVLWLIVFYIAGNQVPGMRDLHNWNYLIGIGLIATSFGVATLWK